MKKICPICKQNDAWMKGTLEEKSFTERVLLEVMKCNCSHCRWLIEQARKES